MVDTYLHQQAGRGVNAVAVVLRGGTQELAHDMAVHIAFARPTYLSREDVPAAEVAAERATVEAISRNEGKPEAALPKIVEGRMNGWFKDRVLLDQSLRQGREADHRRPAGPGRGGAVRPGGRGLLRTRTVTPRGDRRPRG